jgi:hypothetical protein
MKVLLAPWDAFAMAVRMNRLEKAEVDRARLVAIVKGLKRKLILSVYADLQYMHMLTLQ